jgi:dTDP-glucose 4,6-dehydratase
VLLAGGAGFLGSNLTRSLLSLGQRVICVDDFSTGRSENIRELTGRDDFMFIEHDVCEPLTIEQPLVAVCNFASPASPPEYLRRPIDTLRVGSIGTERLIELALAKGARFLMASTSEIYGDPTVHPQPETYWGNVNPIGPRSVYDEAKRYAEALCCAYERAHGLDLRLLRIFNTYGPLMRADDGRVVTNFVNSALRGEPLTIYGDGQQTRSFCYVDDLVDGIVALLDSDHRGPMNLGNPDEFTMAELADLVIELTGSASTIERHPLPEDDPKQRQPDITLARSVLGWAPKVKLREGLSRTIEYFTKINYGDPTCT